MNTITKDYSHKKTMHIVDAKLETKKNEFSLKGAPSRFVPQTYAGSTVDNASAFAVVDLDTGTILTEKDGTKKLPIASITKVMSAIVALDLVNPDTLFTISKKAATVEPTRMGVITGQKMTLGELLSGMLLFSGNDAAEAVKENIDALYDDQIFIDAMNDKATMIGLKNTHFANPQGFDDKHNYSTAEDLAVLTQYALKHYPVIASLVKKDYMILPENKNHKEFDLYNWNSLLDVYPEIEGLKIGNTDDAGKTMIATSSRAGKNIAAIVLGAPTIEERDLMSANLLDIGYKLTRNLPPVNITEEQLSAKYNSWQ